MNLNLSLHCCSHVSESSPCRLRVAGGAQGCPRGRVATPRLGWSGRLHRSPHRRDARTHPLPQRHLARTVSSRDAHGCPQTPRDAHRRPGTPRGRPGTPRGRPGDAQGTPRRRPWQHRHLNCQSELLVNCCPGLYRGIKNRCHQCIRS